jgi:hypothetical protein
VRGVPATASTPPPAARSRPPRCPRRPRYISEVGRADDWIRPLFALGFDSVHALTADQLGQGRRPLLNGAIVVDGQPYSPRLPHHLRDLTPPKIGSPKAAIPAYQQQVAQRMPSALHAVGGRRDDRSWDFGCRAMSPLGSPPAHRQPAARSHPRPGRTRQLPAHDHLHSTAPGHRLPLAHRRHHRRSPRPASPHARPDHMIHKHGGPLLGMAQYLGRLGRRKGARRPSGMSLRLTLPRSAAAGWGELTGVEGRGSCSVLRTRRSRSRTSSSLVLLRSSGRLPLMIGNRTEPWGYAAIPSRPGTEPASGRPPPVELPVANRPQSDLSSSGPARPASLPTPTTTAPEVRTIAAASRAR